MTIDEVVEQLLVLVNSVEKESGILSGDNKIGYFDGIEYKDTDFKNMRRVLDRVHKIYKSNTKSSYKYITKNKEYNKLMSLQNYYRHKANKDSKDYVRLAEIAEKLEVERKKIREEKDNETKKRIKKSKRIEIEEKRRKELLDKYGFIDESDR